MYIRRQCLTAICPES